MKRVTKNVILFAAMAVAVGMLALTLLHGYGMIGGTGNGTVGAPSEGLPSGGPNGDGFGRPDGNNNGSNGGSNANGDGEEIGEVTLPDGGNSGNAPSDNGQEGMTPPDGNGQGMTPPQMPNGGDFGGVDNAGNGGKAPAGTGNGLGGHLAFATVWVFLFAFCLSWAIYSRCNSENAGRKGGDGQWKSEPASSGTN
ncbi:MAG TPA: hypothetical protein DDW30_07920 [Clostridiales bacterium]|nr:hypothetical protein [Clostridiales bacterium]